MKIPTTPPGGTPYYHGPPINGMELNPSWQANGVMVDGAPSNNNNGPYMMQQQGHHHSVPPPQPHHAVPNAGGGYMSQQPGPGSYYPPSEPEDPSTPPHNQDFSEYMWMENQEEFDKQVMQQLEEEALMEQCIEAMLADEREAMARTSDVSLEEQVSKSTLNPLAAEFVPSFLPAASVSAAGDESSSVVAHSASNIELPTEALKELSISKTEMSPTENTHAKDEKPENNNEEQRSSPSTESNIVVVSAKDVLTPKSSIDDSDRASSKSRERKDSEKKKGDAKKKGDTSKKEKTVAAVVTASVVTSKSATKTNAQLTRTLSGGDKSKAAAGEKKQVNSTSGGNKKISDTAATVSKKQEIKVDDTVDLQGPPLPAINVPIVSALSSAPVSEPEKSVPSAPAVFNYAAAARANLPPKQPTQPQTQQAAPKETTPTPNARVTPAPVSSSSATTTKPTNPPNKIDATSRPKSVKSGEKGNATETKKSTAKGTSGNATKKGKK